MLSSLQWLLSRNMAAWKWKHWLGRGVANETAKSLFFSALKEKPSRVTLECRLAAPCETRIRLLFFRLACLHAKPASSSESSRRRKDAWNERGRSDTRDSYRSKCSFNRRLWDSFLFSKSHLSCPGQTCVLSVLHCFTLIMALYRYTCTVCLFVFSLSVNVINLRTKTILA